MATHKRSYEEANNYSVFCLPRNVRARLCRRHSTHNAQTPSESLQSRPILRNSRRRRYSNKSLDFSPSDVKENIPRVNSRLELEAASSLTQDKTTRIRFHQKVAVHRIPARHHYSDDIKRCMWNDMRELKEMARRNSIEFASEGYDWRRATEDEAMVVMPTGERIHPVWEQRRYFQPIRSTHRRVRSTNV